MIVRALDYLGENKMLEIKASEVRQHYHLLKHPENLDELSQNLYGIMHDREKQELARLQQVIDFIKLDKCQLYALANYFDENLTGSCGHCSWCCSQKSVIIEQEVGEFILNDILRSQINLLIKEYPDLFSEQDAIVRVLCGITSPKITRYKLKSHTLFGKFEKIPFGILKSELEKTLVFQ